MPVVVYIFCLMFDSDDFQGAYFMLDPKINRWFFKDLLKIPQTCFKRFRRNDKAGCFDPPIPSRSLLGYQDRGKSIKFPVALS